MRGHVRGLLGGSAALAVLSSAARVRENPQATTWTWRPVEVDATIYPAL
jgi:hypothetical protein